MRSFHIVLVIVLLASLAAAAASAASGESYRLPLSPKTSSSQAPAPSVPAATADKAGGETFETAVVVTALPFTDTGNTCAAVDDYELMCGSYSSAPDLVYAFTPVTDIVLIVDLCESGYDTRIGVYEDFYSGALYDCNEDACGVDGYRSYLETHVAPGHTYYIVIDGWNTDCGEYVLTMDEDVYVPCLDPCPAGAQDEGEGAVPAAYIDSYNSGCDRPYDAFTQVELPMSGSAAVCGLAGCFWVQDNMYWYDTDWYELTATSDVLGISLAGEGYMYAYLYEPDPDCSNMIAIGTMNAEPCLLTEDAFSVTAGHTYYLKVHFEWYPGMYWPMVWSPAEYHVIFSSFDVVGEETTTWGGVKAMFR